MAKLPTLKSSRHLLDTMRVLTMLVGSWRTNGQTAAQHGKDYK